MLKRRVYSKVDSLALVKRFRLLNVFYHTEPASRYFTLLLSSIALSLVSLITTYQGFLFLANNLAAAAALALAIQTTLFWTARELGRKGASWKEGTIFCISAALSISFSYAFIADALTTRDASSTNLVKQIGNALEEVALTRKAVENVAALCEASQDRWSRFESEEANTGFSTPKKFKSKRGGLAIVYQGLATQNGSDAAELRQMAERLKAVESVLVAARNTYEEKLTFSDESLTKLRDAVEKARRVYIDQAVRSSIRNIQDQEQGIFESYFKKFEGTSQAKEFRRLGEQISLSSIPSGPFKNEIELPQLQSNIVRAKQNFENLIFKRTLDTVVAMILAVGLDFMVLLCSWATNFGIPLRVVPNQELTVDTLLHPGPLQDKIPDFVKNVSRGKRGTSIEFWLSKFSTAQQIALADLINKAKVKQKSGSEEFDVAPDFVDFLLRDAYDMAIKESVYQDTERDLRTAEIIGLVIHYKSGLAIPAESIRDKTAISIAVLSLKARGFLVEKRTFWRGAIFYIVTEELIDAWNLQLQAGEYSSAQSLHPQPSLRTDPAPP